MNIEIPPLNPIAALEKAERAGVVFSFDSGPPACLVSVWPKKVSAELRGLVRDNVGGIFRELKRQGRIVLDQERSK